MPSDSPEDEGERAKSSAPAIKEPPTGPKEPTEKSRARSRSRSPRRSPPRRPKNFSGLKWKDSARERGDNRERDSRDPRDRRDDRGDRGGRDRDYGRRDERDRGGGGYGRDGRRDRRDDDRGDRRRDGGRDPERRGDNRRGDDRRDRDDRRRDDDRERKPRPKVPKEDKPKAAPAAAPPVNTQAYSGEPMIMVTVNDRLGTKAAIPCLASDPVKVFKALVAAKIGRASHEIMLKRQGERPFKDHITLGDYGVSNGVQLDLELDTGD